MIRSKIKKIAKNSYLIRTMHYTVTKLLILGLGERKWVECRYKRNTGRTIDLDNPQSLNEKIVWLKLNYHEDWHTACCDKFLIRQYLKDKFEIDYTPTLIFVTQDIKELTIRNIKSFPCIVKVSNGCGANLIIHDSSEFSDKYIQNFFRAQIVASNCNVLRTQEHQYLQKKPYLVVEELLDDGNGHIPNDYKFLYINGQLQFVYCSLDREGKNIRQIYDESWNRKHFIWVKHANKSIYDKYENTKDIPRPHYFNKMVDISGMIAKDFPIVRVDFYETRERMYIGEITLHHGSGEDKFYPTKYDLYYGKKLILPKKNR